MNEIIILKFKWKTKIIDVKQSQYGNSDSDPKY